ncbi:MAG: hypothetical protein PHG18_05390 [Bacilli bacterium]|nr:hypothetical protein [Bacilli bacterium]
MAKATNYIPMGYWVQPVAGDPNKPYYRITDMGIPMVKIADGTALGYSVWVLQVDVSNNIKPSSTNHQWKLVESTEFIYIQQAYIERLQAQLISAVTVELKEDLSSDVTAGFSGIQGAAKDQPALWAGGTYAEAISGVAKAIIKHDGSGHLAGGNIKWNIAGNTEFLGGVKSPFTDISNATIEQFWEEEITSWANNFFENQYTTSLTIRIIPCSNLLNGQVFRIHALQRGIQLQPEEYNGFYENGTLLNEIQLNKGDAVEMVCICFNDVFHSWDIIRRYKCRPYDL